MFEAVIVIIISIGLFVLMKIRIEQHNDSVKKNRK